MTPIFRIVLWAAALASAGVAGKKLVESFGDEDFYARDFVQEYVLARCLVDGEPPYRPLPELVDKYFPDRPTVPWTHPTPHPPPTALMTLPLGFVSYRVASVGWLVLQLACLALAVELLARCWGGAVTREVKTIAFLASMGLGPIVRDLYLGQFSIILTVLMTLAWRNLRTRRDGWGGIWLGLAVSLKMVGWPIGLYLAIRRRWRAVAMAAIVFVAMHVVSAAVMGWPAIRQFYVEVGARVAQDNRCHLENFSLWTLGSRLFMAEPMTWSRHVVLEPLAPMPHLERPTAILVPLIALIAAMTLACRVRSFDSAFGVLVCCGLLLNPVAWDHYLVLTALPIVIVVRRLAADGSRWQKRLAGLGLAITILPRPGDLHLAIHLWSRPAADGLHLPFAPGLLTYLPLVPLTIWIGLLAATDADDSQRDPAA